MSDTSNPVELDYTNRDFDSIRTFLVSAARGYVPEWVTVGEPADFGTLLLELYAYVGDVLNYYIDRVAAEPFLASAVRRQSILGIADMLGYSPIAQQSATGVVTFTLADKSTVAVTVPTGTVIQTPVAQTLDAISFETIGAAYLDPNAIPPVMSMVVGAQEGRTVSDELMALSTGAPLQEYVLRYAGVIQRSMVLSVKETDQEDPNMSTAQNPVPLLQVWSYVDNLVDTDPDASVYTTYVDDRGFMHIVFGDNVAGRIPPVSAELHITYRYGVGAQGNVAANLITLITPPIPSVSVNNATAFTGGADAESIDSMRHGIPRAAKLRDRAITLQDFADLCHQVPGVAKAVAIGEFYTQVKLYIAPVGGGYPSQQLEDQVYDYVLSRSLVGTTIEIHPTTPAITPPVDPIYTYVLVHLKVHILPQYGQLTVVNAVTQAITNVFAFDSSDFAALISRGQVYHAVLAVTGVDWIELLQLQPMDDSGNPVGAVVQDIQAGPTHIPISDAAHITVDVDAVDSGLK